MIEKSPNHEITQSPNRYWRSLNELANDPRFTAALEDEFASYDPAEIAEASGVSRRSFVKLMAASMALAGLTLTGCRRWPEQRVLPYANRPAGRDPNTTQHYATMLTRGGIAHALLVTTYTGRPIKVEGNPEHPVSKGATDALAQASILELYDPYRARGVEHDGAKASWADVFQFLHDHVTADGRGVAILAEPDDSPALAKLKAELLAKHRDLKWYTWTPLHRDNATAGTRDAFGRTLRPQYHLDKADVIVCLDADVLGRHPAEVKHARDWAKGRRSADQGKMNRLYVVESTLSNTGSVADHRLPVSGAGVGNLAAEILAGVGGGNVNHAFAQRVVRDLAAHKSRSVVIAGDGQPPQVHELAWQINLTIGAIGQTVTLTPEPDYEQPMTTQIGELTSAIHAGAVGTLIILGGNPVYDAPAELKFAEALAKVGQTAHLTLYPNETTGSCQWQLPKAHDFEAWGDGLSWDGTHCLRQPLILPLFEGRSTIELLAMMLGEIEPNGEMLVRDAVTSDDAAWRASVQAGFVNGSAAADAGAINPQTHPVRLDTPASRDSAASGGGAFEVQFLADSKVYDGSHAENGWMQEMPDGLTKLTWDNAALFNVGDARDLKLKPGDIVEIAAGGATIRIAAYLMPGQARGTIGLPLGYGRKAAGNVGTGVGFDVYPLRTTLNQFSLTGATVRKTGQRYQLATTTDHYPIDNIGTKLIRDRVGEPGKSGIIIKEASLDYYKSHPSFVRENAHGDVRLQMYTMPMDFTETHAWGMTIDLSACTGCGACVIACQSENNVPIVGKDMVLMSREMHWLRIDRYFKTHDDDTDLQNPQVVHMPMMCVHCENAPCEQVCPVGATTHDAEGLNVMVYNRCIGTRYCSNNCPYKVRRFNYFDFHAKNPRGMAKPWLGLPDTQQVQEIDPVRQMTFNPDVTVRMRGVMEKCTYCVQRIAHAKTVHRVEQVQKHADHEHRMLPDGAVVTACQQACATEAIVFGNLLDERAKVTQVQKTTPRGYDVLDELNTRPRTKYLALIRNTNEG